METRTKQYDLFIAYHGTNNPQGTYAIAKELCDYCEKEGYVVYLHGYSCMTEHKDVQWNRTWEIVDRCQCFIAIVNDSAPRNSTGHLGNDIGDQESQIRAEVDAFYDLVSRNMANRSDFNFFYTGNKLKGEEQITFFRELHSQLINGHNQIIAWNAGTPADNFKLILKWLEKRGCSAKNEEYQLKKLRELLEGLGWGRSILFSPRELHTYERKISPDLKSVLLVAANTTDDVRGGAIYPLVAENLERGVHYTYLFFEYPGARRQLESIYQSHSDVAKENLTLQLVKSKAWIGADILLIKIYEFKSQDRPEIFFRIKMSTDKQSEQCIYVKGAEIKVPIIQQEIDEMIDEQTVVTFDGKKWV